MTSTVCIFVLVFLLPAFLSILLLQYSSIPAAFFSATPRPTTNVYIVYTGEREHQDPDVALESHLEILTTVLKRKEAAKASMIYSYRHGFSGFAAKLTESQAEQIAALPDVLRVSPNQIYRLRTTRSWEFLGFSNSSTGDDLDVKGNYGKGVIIGVVDTGIWPESASFNDTEMDPAPQRWRGICQEGERFNASNCNKKIIGARWFLAGLINSDPHALDGTNEVRSARDMNGHGTHTASTAAGSLVQGASYRGLAAGVAKGGARLAHIAVYKVCWAGRCSDADILAAFENATDDGVDVLSLSFGSMPPFVGGDDPSISAAFSAVANFGISVVYAAGNSGPATQTVANIAPWVLTVGASSIDRSFPTKITLGNNLTYTGQALYQGGSTDQNYNLVYVGSCERPTLTPAENWVALCFCYERQNVLKIEREVQEAGGAGIIFAQSPPNRLVSCQFMPCISVSYISGTKIYIYIKSTTSRIPTARLSSSTTDLGHLVSPSISYFSSRGPSSFAPAVLKPDIAAPGSNILAAWSPEASFDPGDYKIESGTSMACPHISGIVALLKVVHPEWSPAAIKSALVTTANTTDKYGQQIEEESGVRKLADPFDYGGGHVNPNAASDPGLVYNMSAAEYALFFCALGYSSRVISAVTYTSFTFPQEGCDTILLNLNLPSITIPNLRNDVTVKRTVTNVGEDKNAVYRVSVEPPTGVIVDVNPQTLSFTETTSKLTYEVHFAAAQQKQGFYTFGSLTWSDGAHNVRIPISVRTTLDDDIGGDYTGDFAWELRK